MFTGRIQAGCGRVKSEAAADPVQTVGLGTNVRNLPQAVSPVIGASRRSALAESAMPGWIYDL